MTPTKAPWDSYPDSMAELHPIRSRHAPRSLELKDGATAHYLNHHVAGFYDMNVRNFIVLARNNETALRSFDIDAGLYIELAKAFSRLGGVSEVFSGPIQIDGIELEAGSIPIYMATKSLAGRTKRQKIGMVARGDGSDGTDDAALIVELFSLVPSALVAVKDKIFVTREVDGINITLDADLAPLFDEARWKTVPVYHNGDTRMVLGSDVVNAKTNERLADLILGSDGLILSAVSPDRKDFRLQSLSTVDRRVMYSVMLTPEEVEILRTESARTGRDQGRILVGGLHHVA